MKDPIVDLLVERREELGLSRRELARRIGTSPSTVHYWETGERNPTLYSLRSWTKVLGYELMVTLDLK